MEELVNNPNYTKKGVSIISDYYKQIVDYTLDGLGTASYYFITERGTSQGSLNYSCSAGWKYTGMDACVYVIRRAYQERYLTDKEGDAYYYYLLNQSPYAECFITKDVQMARKYGVEFNMQAPAKLCYGASIALRVWEWVSVGRSFYKLVSAGCIPNLAFLLAHSVNCEDESVRLLNYFQEGLHNPLDSRVYTESGAFLNFLEGTYEYAGERLLFNKDVYGCGNLFSNSRPDTPSLDVLVNSTTKGGKTVLDTHFHHEKPLALDTNLTKDFVRMINLEVEKYL